MNQLSINQIITFAVGLTSILWSIIAGIVIILRNVRNLRVKVGSVEASTGETESDDSVRCAPVKCSMKEVIMDMYTHQQAQTAVMQVLLKKAYNEEVNGELEEAHEKLRKIKSKQDENVASLAFGVSQ